MRRWLVFVQKLPFLQFASIRTALTKKQFTDYSYLKEKGMVRSGYIRNFIV